MAFPSCEELERFRTCTFLLQALNTIEECTVSPPPKYTSRFKGDWESMYNSGLHFTELLLRNDEVISAMTCVGKENRPLVSAQNQRARKDSQKRPSKPPPSPLVPGNVKPQSFITATLLRSPIGFNEHANIVMQLLKQCYKDENLHMETDSFRNLELYTIISSAEKIKRRVERGIWDGRHGNIFQCLVKPVNKFDAESWDAVPKAMDHRKPYTRQQELVLELGTLMGCLEMSDIMRPLYDRNGRKRFHCLLREFILRVYRPAYKLCELKRTFLEKLEDCYLEDPDTNFDEAVPIDLEIYVKHLMEQAMDVSIASGHLQAFLEQFRGILKLHLKWLSWTQRPDLDLANQLQDVRDVRNTDCETFEIYQLAKEEGWEAAADRHLRLIPQHLHALSTIGLLPKEKKFANRRREFVAKINFTVVEFHTPEGDNKMIPVETLLKELLCYKRRKKEATELPCWRKRVEDEDETGYFPLKSDDGEFNVQYILDWLKERGYNPSKPSPSSANPALELLTLSIVADSKASSQLSNLPSQVLRKFRNLVPALISRIALDPATKLLVEAMQSGFDIPFDKSRSVMYCGSSGLWRFSDLPPWIPKRWKYNVLFELEKELNRKLGLLVSKFKRESEEREKEWRRKMEGKYPGKYVPREQERGPPRPRISDADFMTI